MASKMSTTLIIEANLECEKCYKKIQKVLCKLQVKENIKTINFDTAKNTVTISGPFDPEKLMKKLRCRACEAIKCIKVQKEKKPDEKKPEPKKEEKKEEKKPEEEKKKPEEKKTEEVKKKPEEKKPEEKKTSDEKPKGKVEEAKAEAAPSWSTTVNLQFTQMCGICYPWPCSDPSQHCGLVHPQPQQQKPQPPPPQLQWPSCEGMAPPQAQWPAFPGHHQYPPCAGAAGPAPAQRWPTCGGPSYCGGCGSCRGGGMHGWPAMPPPMPLFCSGPSSCRGCKGCRIVQENKYVYEEYPPSACAVM